MPPVLTFVRVYISMLFTKYHSDIFLYNTNLRVQIIVPHACLMTEASDCPIYGSRAMSYAFFVVSAWICGRYRFLCLYYAPLRFPLLRGSFIVAMLQRKTRLWIFMLVYIAYFSCLLSEQNVKYKFFWVITAFLLSNVFWCSIVAYVRLSIFAFHLTAYCDVIFQHAGPTCGINLTLN